MARSLVDEAISIFARGLLCLFHSLYVDDMILLAQDRNLLAVWAKSIASFLHERLKLEVRSDMSKPFWVGNGIDFVGWKT